MVVIVVGCGFVRVGMVWGGAVWSGVVLDGGCLGQLLGQVSFSKENSDSAYQSILLTHLRSNRRIIRLGSDRGTIGERLGSDRGANMKEGTRSFSAKNQCPVFLSNSRDTAR